MGYLDFHKEQGDMMADTNLMWKYVGFLWQVGSLSCDNTLSQSIKLIATLLRICWRHYTVIHYFNTVLIDNNEDALIDLL